MNVLVDLLTESYRAGTTIVFTIGLWGLFEKCGVEGWWAMIPGARKYWLGRCADENTDGKILAILDAIMLFPSAIISFLPDDTLLKGNVLILLLTLNIIYLVYSFRVYAGLCRMFRQKKRIALLWLVADFLLAPLWGFSAKYQPRRKVRRNAGGDPVLTDADRAALAESVDDNTNGLAVHLRKRTVRNLLEKRCLLREIYMTVKPGHMVLLLGGSGAGKTTFVNAVIGYEKADAKILLNGMNVYEDYDEMQYDIGYVPQQDLMRGNDTVFQTLTDAANLRLPTDVPGREVRELVKSTLEQFGLTSIRNNLVGTLSGGQRKRLSIAMEYISDPYLFVLDEPDSGLDGVIARDLMEHLRRIADEGKIVIVITHSPDRSIDLFDDVIVLAKDSQRTGRLAFYGTVEEAREFFGKDKMEDILQLINQKEEGGEGRAEEFIAGYAERQVS